MSVLLSRFCISVSAGSVEGSGLGTLGRAPPAEYEPARHAPAPASLDRRYVPTYVGTYFPPSTDTAALKSAMLQLFNSTLWRDVHNYCCSWACSLITFFYLKELSRLNKVCLNK